MPPLAFPKVYLDWSLQYDDHQVVSTPPLLGKFFLCPYLTSFLASVVSPLEVKHAINRFSRSCSSCSSIEPECVVTRDCYFSSMSEAQSVVHEKSHWEPWCMPYITRYFIKQKNPSAASWLVGVKHCMISELEVSLLWCINLCLGQVVSLSGTNIWQSSQILAAPLVCSAVEVCILHWEDF